MSHWLVASPKQRLRERFWPRLQSKGLAAGGAGAVFSTGADVGDCCTLALNPTDPQDKTREKREPASYDRICQTPSHASGWKVGGLKTA